jgi:MFS family permease
MAGMSLRPYSAILRTPQVPRLVSTAVVGRLSIGMSGLALVLLVRQAGGSYALAGVVAGALALGAGVSAPLLGRIVDRNGQTLLLLGCAVVCTAAFTGIAAVAATGPNPLLPAIAAVAGATLPPIGACMRALWSSLLGRGSELQAAFAFEATVQELIFVLGPLLVVALIAVASPTAAVLAIAATVLVGTCLFAATPASRAWRPASGQRDWAGALRGSGMRTILGVITLLALSFGIIEVSVPAVAEQLGSSKLSGLFLALWSGGSMLGGLTAGALTTGRPPERRVVVLLGLIATGLAPLAAAMTGVLPFAACMILAGLGIAPAIACLYLLVDRSAPSGTVTEAFTWVTSAFTAGSAMGSALGGSIVEHAGPGAAFLLAVGGVSAAMLLARVGRPSLAAPVAPALEPEAA